MYKEQVIHKLKQQGVVAVIRGTTPEEAIDISKACIAGGLTAIEVTFTTPGAHDVIRHLSHDYAADENVVIGAGTVLDPETARIALLNGASFVVSPSFNLETIQLCNRYRVACMPGATTVEGVIAALEAGVDIIKVFPGELYGPKIIKAFKGPIPQAQLMPTGGVSIDNIKEWFDAGAVAVGVGGALTKNMEKGNFSTVTETAKKFVAGVKAARQK